MTDPLAPPLDLALHPALHGRGAAFRARVAEAAAAEARGVAADLGLPVAPAVSVREGDETTDLSVALSGAPLFCAAWARCEIGRALHPERLEEEGDPRLFLAAPPEGAHPADDAAAARFLALAVGAALWSDPARLVPDETAAALLDAAGLDGADAAMRAAAGGALRGLAALAIPVDDLSGTLAVIASARAEGEGDAELRETLIAALRPMTLDIEMHPALAEELLGAVPEAPVHVAPDGPAAAAKPAFDVLADGLFANLGVRIPPARILTSSGLPARAFRCRVNRRPSPPWIGLRPGEAMADAEPGALDGAGGPERAAPDPLDGTISVAVSAERGRALANLGHAVWDAWGHVVRGAAAHALRNAPCLIDADLVALEMARIAAPAPLDPARRDPPGARPDAVARVLRALLRDGVPIRDLRAILDRIDTARFAALASPDSRAFGDVLGLEEGVRAGLDPAETAAAFVRLPHGEAVAVQRAMSGRTLLVLPLDADRGAAPVLDRLRGARPWSPGDGARIAAALDPVAGVTRAPQSWAVVASPGVAAALRAACGAQLPQLAVLARQEIRPGMRLMALPAISLEPPRDVDA